MILFSYDKKENEFQLMMDFPMNLLNMHTSTSIKRILLAAQYFKIRALVLYNIEIETFAQLIQGSSFIYSRIIIFTDEITRDFDLSKDNNENN